VIKEEERCLMYSRCSGLPTARWSSAGPDARHDGRKFADAARAHIAYEEQQVWPAFRAALPADEAYGLGAQLASATQAGPTRPHPHTPPSPALLKAMGPVVAAADKLRDAASGRDN
jgi:hypothetical protein